MSSNFSVGVQRVLCRVCLGLQGGECQYCNGTGYEYRSCYSSRFAIDPPSDEELELDRLRAELRRLAATVCCPTCGTEIERRAS